MVGWRRQVASPVPLRIIERTIIQDLLDRDHIVVACGGGGVAVAKDESGRLIGVTAVIDKDLTSALLADKLDAQLMIISTAVDRVALNFGHPNETWLDKMNIDEAVEYEAAGHFGVGSMGPKVKAAIAFLENGGQRQPVEPGKGVLGEQPAGSVVRGPFHQSQTESHQDQKAHD